MEAIQDANRLNRRKQEICPKYNVIFHEPLTFKPKQSFTKLRGWFALDGPYVGLVSCIMYM